MKKGTRVQIIGGRNGKGESGTIFWTGKNKWGDGERFGVRADSGETYWVADKDVEPTNAAPPPAEAGPTFNKGDRVAFSVRGREGTGTVFWIGKSKHGPGQRLGVRDDDPESSEDAVWLEARQARAIEGEAPPRPQQGHYDEDEGAEAVLSAESYAMPPLDEGPPIDDSWVEQMAAQDEEEEDPFFE